MLTDDQVVARMGALIQQWEQDADQEAIFLRCYMLMTNNMLAAIERREFHDPEWVNTLLTNFAEYYFTALDAYQRSPASAPAVWRMAHNVARDHSISALQNLLLGVNAHINYDLVLALVDILQPEWDSLSDSQRSMRYADHCHVNHVIGSTIDAVQDQILDPAMPLMELFDKLLGPIDELMVSQLITHWRESVWEHASRLLAAGDAGEQARLKSKMEEEALRTGEVICPKAFLTLSSRGWQTV
jgi:hypothetical protein